MLLPAPSVRFIAKIWSWEIHLAPDHPISSWMKEKIPGWTCRRFLSDRASDPVALPPPLAARGLGYFSNRSICFCLRQICLCPVVAWDGRGCATGLRHTPAWWQEGMAGVPGVLQHFVRLAEQAASHRLPIWQELGGNFTPSQRSCRL